MSVELSKNQKKKFMFIFEWDELSKHLSSSMILNRSMQLDILLR